ncbi:hypothetical protein [Escherichia coli]|uniref:hypothetical protein n=1 Tax=Escherichia coli TaxID=562 RepID=UPI002ACC3023|nr:hypothetical protein [Escherichia coli]
MNWQKKKIERSIKYQTRVFNEHINELVITRRNGKVITVNDGREMIEFVSCSYLGLETHENLKHEITNALKDLESNFRSPERA